MVWALDGAACMGTPRVRPGCSSRTYVLSLLVTCPQAIGSGVPASVVVQMNAGAGSGGPAATTATGAPALLSGMWGCHGGRTAGSDDSGPAAGGRLFRPTMRLVGLHGRPVFVRVAVHSREEGGEPLHVVRMAR